MKVGHRHAKAAQRLLQTQGSVAGTRGGYGRSIHTQCSDAVPVTGRQNVSATKALRLGISPVSGKTLRAFPARSVAGQRRAFATVKHGM